MKRAKKVKGNNGSAVRTNVDRYIPKPMGPEDAVQILEDEKLDFLVFRILNERVCVIYQEEDGHYSVIDTYFILYATLRSSISNIMLSPLLNALNPLYSGGL